MIAAQGLLVSSSSYSSLETFLLEEQCIILPQLLLLELIISEHSRRSVYEFRGENCLCSVDKSKGCLSGGSIWCRPDRPKSHRQLLYPVSSALAQPIEGSCLEPAQHFSIGPLRLTIAPRVSNRSETDLGAKVLDVLHEGATSELCAVVGDDPVRDSETANNRPEEPDRRLCCHLSHWFHFWPLCELVDCNVQVLKAPDSTGERAEDIEPPDREGPGQRERLESLSWLMNLVGMELARFTLGYLCSCILEGFLPKEPLPECLPGKCPCANVVTTYASMYFCQQLLSIFSGNALQPDTIEPSSVQFIVNELVHT